MVHLEQSCCCRSSFSSFASKWGKDSRFKGVEKMREKEDIFNEYVQELYKKEKEERKEKKEKVRGVFPLFIFLVYICN